MDFKTKIIKTEWLAYNVVRLECEIPKGFEYSAGDAIEMQVGDEGPGPFTMTSLPDWNKLEFMIRIYKDHHGLTKAVSELKEGDEIGLTEPFNTFVPKGESVFLAGGTGITPFVAILRKMHRDKQLGQSQLFFSNKSRRDLFLEEELHKMMGDRYQNVITSDKEDPEYEGRITKEYLQSRVSDFTKPIYICGPEKFQESMQELLKELGVDSDKVNLSN